MSHEPDNVFARTQVASLVEVREMNHAHGPSRPFWSKERHRDFERTSAETKLPERLGYEAANRLLIKARRGMASQ